jgi:hypothetical protein
MLSTSTKRAYKPADGRYSSEVVATSGIVPTARTLAGNTPYPLQYNIELRPPSLRAFPNDTIAQSAHVAMEACTEALSAVLGSQGHVRQITASLAIRP